MSQEGGPAVEESVPQCNVTAVLVATKFRKLAPDLNSSDVSFNHKMASSSVSQTETQLNLEARIESYMSKLHRSLCLPVDKKRWSSMIKLKNNVFSAKDD